jgi:hypothetical protein
MAGHHDDSSADDANRLLNAQLRQSASELEEKRQTLYKQRLGIIKSQGATNWTPQATVKNRSAQNAIPRLPGFSGKPRGEESFIDQALGQQSLGKGKSIGS